ncbi:hypothetical protein T484DRAFT_1794969 [Baffinella frigidus]|nr:hypothetical protein T484DRAFT_1794969 [Cryptophyta sp. CCMP2293]
MTRERLPLMPAWPARGRSAGRILDPYVLPRAQFGTHTIAPPVPTSAGTGRFVPPDIRWAAEQSRASQELGHSQTREDLATEEGHDHVVALLRAVEYWLPFTFPGVHPNETVFNFTPPPFVIATPRIHSDLVPEHGNQVSDTFAVSVIEVPLSTLLLLFIIIIIILMLLLLLILLLFLLLLLLPPLHFLLRVTSAGFMVRVFRTDRSGETWPDRGGRGWSKTLDIDWIAWEPSVADFTVLQAGVLVASEVKENEYMSVMHPRWHQTA